MRTIASYCIAAFVASSAMVKAQSIDREQRAPAIASHDPAHLAEPIYWCAVHVSKGEFVAAMSDCDYSVSQFPTKADAFVNRGGLHLQLGDRVRAMADFDQAIALAPNEAMMHYNRGVANSELEEIRAAIRDFSRAVELNSSLVPAYHNRGREYEKLGEREKAIADFERALGLDPGFVLPTRRLRILRGDL